VVGRIFWDALLGEIENMDHSPDQELDALCQCRLVIPQAISDFDGINEFAFKHAILRDVTYETLLKRDRKRYHARVAAWLEKITRASGRLAVSAIAGHYSGRESPLAATVTSKLENASSRAFRKLAIYSTGDRLVAQDVLTFSILLGWVTLGNLGK
jgi:hypothetical protein